MIIEAEETYVRAQRGYEKALGAEHTSTLACRGSERSFNVHSQISWTDRASSHLSLPQPWLVEYRLLIGLLTGCQLIQLVS